MIRTKYVEKKKQIKNKKQTKENVCMLHVCAGRMHMLVQQLCMCDWKEEITHQLLLIVRLFIQLVEMTCV